MEKKKLNENKSGFTLIEILAVIVIISLLFSMGFYCFDSIITNSKEKSENIAYNNIKMSANDYVKEFKKDIVWDGKKVCISPQTLVSEGFLDKEVLKVNKEVKSIIVEKDENGQILSEQIKDDIDCPTYLRTVEIPKSSDICVDATYDGSQIDDLIKSDGELGDDFKAYYKDGSYNKETGPYPVNAGKYKVVLELIAGKQWEDKTTEPKEITCTIKKKNIDLKLFPNGVVSEEIIEKNEVKVYSEIKGTIEVKSSNKEHVTGNVNNEVKNINPTYSSDPLVSDDYSFFQYYGIVDITKHANRDTTTYITITIKPDNPESVNYNKTSITYVVGKINKKLTKVTKPTNAICNKNNKYTGSDIVLVKTNEDDPYLVYNNIQREIGNYEVRFSLKYGYIWDDGSNDDITINCDILAPTPEVTYENAVCNPQKIIVTYGQIYGLNQKLCVPSQTGKTFEGWYIDNNHITKITDNSQVKNPNDHTLYPKWNNNKYTINYDCNGGLGTTASSTHTYNVEKNLTANGCSKSGYTFNGWNTNKYGTGTSYTDKQSVKNLATENGATVTLYAKWTKIEETYTVSYNCNGGYGRTNDSIHTIGEYKQLNANGCSRTSYVFSGWTMNNNGTGTLYTDRQSVKNLSSTNGATVTLYAKWAQEQEEPITYTVKYNCNGGTGTMTNSIHTVGEYKQLNANKCSRTNYTFNGWTMNSNGTGTLYTDKQSVRNLTTTNGSTVTLYAKWAQEQEEPITYTVKYNCNGGSGTTASSTHTYNVAKNLTANGCSKSGYTFNGWNTNSSGTGTSYTDRQSVKNLSSTNGATVTLYAKWTGQSSSGNTGGTTTPSTDNNPPTITCDNSSYSWSNTVGQTKITATDPEGNFKEIRYKPYKSTGDYSSTTNNPFNYSGSKVAWVSVYARDTFNNQPSTVTVCQTKYDGLKPYIPYVSKVEKGEGVSSISENCTAKSDKLLSATSCTVTATKTSSSTHKVLISINTMDQPADTTNYTSLSSGNIKRNKKITYKDGSTCQDTYNLETKKYSPSECDDLNAKKYEMQVTDRAGNTSEKLTINIEWK